MSEGLPRRTALITGASAGIGAAFARVFAAHDFDLVVTARREAKLRALAADLERQHGMRVHVLVADLADPTAPARLESDVASAGLAIDALVNNAGYGVPGTYLSVPWRQHAEFLQVMVTAVAELSHRFLPGMIQRRYGRIINVSSLAGLLPGTAGHTLYAAAKAFLVKMSESLALEGEGHNVHVTALCPGFTYTEFHDVTGTRDLVQQLPRWAWLDADFVAREGYDAVMRGRLVSVPGGVQKAVAQLARYTPLWLFRRAMRTQAGKYRRT